MVGEQFLTTMFLYDGTWMATSPSYNAETIDGISVIHSALEPKLAGRTCVRLAGVRIVETASNAFEYGDLR